MSNKKSFHSLCKWTFHSGKGGFVPANIRSNWSADKLDTIGVIKLIKEKIAPRLPDNIQTGFEIHYNNEVNEDNAKEIADALVDSKIYLAMITPGAHIHFGYGGISSLDDKERKEAEEFGIRTVDLVYKEMKKAWHPNKDKFPTLVLWNGSYGYDVASIGIQRMYHNLKESIAGLCEYEKKLGEELYVGIEPKPNEGHPAMLLPTVASAVTFWYKLKKEFGISLDKKGVNKEFGHSEMIGLDSVYDTVEEIDNNMLVHMHVNSQGYNDGLIFGGPGRYDIDHGVRINGINIAIAGLAMKANYHRWKGHDMQVRPYDNEEQGIERVIRSILSWEACEQAAEHLDEKLLIESLSKRDTAKAEDIMRELVQIAYKKFDEWYNG